MVATKDSFLDFMQGAFEKLLVEAYENGADEDILLEAVGPAYERVRAKTKSIFLPALKRNAAKMLRDRRKQIAGFEKRNFARWREAFDRFEMLVVMVEEIGQEQDLLLRPEAIARQDYKFEALAHLLPRAVLVAREMLCLLKGGYPDSALARWRSLYELSVLGQFIFENDVDIALRYLASFDFRALRAAREYNDHAERGDLLAFDEEELSALEARAAGVEAQIGERLKKDYDWAHPALVSQFPTLKPDRVDFSHIELSVGMDHWRPRFRYATQNVHAGYRPHATLLGVCESQEPVALVGPSNSGFVDPLQMGAISLVHVATTFLLVKPNLDRLVLIDILTELSDELPVIAIRLEEETLAAHRKATSSRTDDG
jgi:hypothetical protein